MKKLPLIFSQLVLLLLLVFTASGVVNAKVASGPQNLSPSVHQGQTLLEAPSRLGSGVFSYDGLSGSPLVPKGTKSRGYDRPEVETKADHAKKQSDAIKDWDDHLGPNQTNIDPRDGLPDPDRIWSADGKRSIRFGPHEMNSKPNKLHYHRETWHKDKVENVLQRVQK